MTKSVIVITMPWCCVDFRVIFCGGYFFCKNECDLYFGIICDTNDRWWSNWIHFEWRKASLIPQMFLRKVWIRSVHCGAFRERDKSILQGSFTCFPHSRKNYTDSTQSTWLHSLWCAMWIVKSRRSPVREHLDEIGPSQFRNSYRRTTQSKLVVFQQSAESARHSDYGTASMGNGLAREFEFCAGNTSQWRLHTNQPKWEAPQEVFSLWVWMSSKIPTTDLNSGNAFRFLLLENFAQIPMEVVCSLTIDPDKSEKKMAKGLIFFNVINLSILSSP